MRKLFVVFLLIVFSSFISSAFALSLDLDLSLLSRGDLMTLSTDVKTALEQYHTNVTDVEKESALSAVKSDTEKYYSEQGISISWAWYDHEYKYERNWDYITVSTHIDYKDSDDKSHQVKVYGEVFPINGQKEVFFLTLDKNQVYDNRNNLPDILWDENEKHFVNLRTGIDLTVLSESELKDLQNLIKDELSKNHKTTSKGESTVKTLVGKAVEDHFAQSGIKVSWPWFDYDFTCDWGYYTETTRISYKDSEEKKHDKAVYAEVINNSTDSEIVYLIIGDETLIDLRNQMSSDTMVTYSNSILFSAAFEQMKNGDYVNAIGEFTELKGFSNSQQMVIMCQDLIKEETYKEGVRLFSQGAYSEAMAQFLSLDGYSDSQTQAKLCQEKIFQQQYDQAVTMMTNGDYEGAIALFNQAIDYSDSTILVQECYETLRAEKYDHATSLLVEEKFAEAQSIFVELPGYKDSDVQVEYCQEQINLGLYTNAVSAMDSGEFESAIDTLLSLGTYRDSETLVVECKEKINARNYALAAILLEGGHFDEAYDQFSALGEYSDSKDMADKCLLAKDHVDRRIVFTDNEIYIYVNKNEKLNPTVEILKEGAPEKSNIAYRSSDTNIVKVAKNGNLTALHEGTARIICSTEDNPDNITEVIVHVVLPVKRLSLDKKTITISFVPGDASTATAALVPSISPDNAFDKSIMWDSSNEQIVTVNDQGVITAVAPGRATVTATANDKTNGVKRVTCQVIVELAVTEIQLEQSSGTVFIGKTETLKAIVLPEKATNKKITWSSSNPEVATVTNKGQVKGISTGSATITAQSANGVKANYSVTVRQGPATFSVSAKATCVDKNHVGSDWSKEFFVDDKQYSGSTTFTAELNQTVSFSCDIVENDNIPDRGGLSVSLEMSEDVFKNGYIIDRTVYVEENGGRYSGYSAEWHVVITIKKKAN